MKQQTRPLSKSVFLFHRIKNLFVGQKLARQKQRLSKPEYAYLFDTPLSKVPHEWVSLDLEMTGLNAKQDYILSVGAVQVRKESNGFVIDTDSALSLVCRPPVMPTHDTIVIHGEHDEVISLAQVLDWARPQSLPVVVFPGVGHFFHGKLVLLQQYVQRRVPSL